MKATVTLSILLLTFLVELEDVDHLSENESHRRRPTSKAKSPVVLISPL